jgi:hypothetical protein
MVYLRGIAMAGWVFHKTHKDNIRVGDAILHDGELRIVGEKDLKYTEFSGLCIFGDSYKLGYEPVIKGTFVTEWELPLN